MLLGSRQVKREADFMESWIDGDPTWYERFKQVDRALLVGTTALWGIMQSSGSLEERMSNGYYAVFEELLSRGAIPLGSPFQAPDGLDGPPHEWDSERKRDAEGNPVTEKLVIYHTSRESIDLSALSAMHFARLYLPHYQNPPKEEEKYVAGRPIYSGHFRREDERVSQVFYAYHWLVEKDGESSTQLLKPGEVGWHVGKWAVNCETEAIAISDDLTHKKPNPNVYTEIGRIIREHYPHLKPSKDTIIGAQEVNPRNRTAGELFLGEDEQGHITSPARGWKYDLLNHIGA